MSSSHLDILKETWTKVLLPLSKDDIIRIAVNKIVLLQRRVDELQMKLYNQEHDFDIYKYIYDENNEIPF